MELRGKQKRFLRSEAHHLTPIFQIGKGGLNEAMINQIEEALEKRELIKVSLLQNTDEVAEDAATAISEARKFVWQSSDLIYNRSGLSSA